MTTTLEAPTPPPAPELPRRAARGTQEGHVRPRDRRAGDRRQLPQAQPARAARPPGDLRGRDRQRLHDGPVPSRLLEVDDERERVRGLVTLFLWATVLFANFAEAMAEGRGKAQAASLRKTRTETMANRRRADGTVEHVPSTALDVGDECVVAAGEVIPSDGDVIEGIASVDESAITGESAPVDPRVGRRPLGGDRRHASAVRRDRRADHRRSRARRSSTG